MNVFTLFMLMIAAVQTNDVGVSVFSNATEMPEVTARLMETKGSTWIAARAYRTDDSVKNVVKHFRDVSASLKTSAGENAVLKRLLDDNWNISDGIVGSAHVVFGLSKDLRTVAKERTKVSFGTILLEDSFVRVHIMSPYPVPPAGVNVTKGTMIVMIRERIPNPADIAVSAGGEEEAFPGWEVTRKIRIRSKPHPNHLPGVYGSVVLKAVFGSSGKVTHVVVVSGVPGLTEESIRAARKIIFDPAIKDGRYVAQWVQLEYNFY